MGNEHKGRVFSGQTWASSHARAHLRALIESTQDLIWSVDLDYRLVTFNKALSDAFERGWGVRIKAGMTPRDLLDPEKAAFFPPLYDKALREGSCSAEYQLRDGRYLEMSFNPIVESGKALGVSVFGKDLTRQKSAEMALRKTAEQYREIFEFAPEAIFRATEEGKVLAANPAGAKLLGYDSVGEAIASLDGQTHRAWFDDAERSAFLETMKKNGGARSAPSQFRRKDGSLFWGIMTVRKICGPDGTALYYQGFLEDVTEQMASREALVVAEKRYREIFETAPEGIFRTTKNGKSLDLNPAGARMLGFENPAEALRAISDTARDVWLRPEERAHYVAILEECGELHDFQTQFKRMNGDPIWVSLTTRRVCDSDGNVLYYQGFIQDIEERKRLEEELTSNIRELRILSEMNNALLTAKTEDALLAEYCRILVEVGSYRMAWVGFADDGPEKQVVPVAHYGHEDGYMKTVNVTWEDSERGRGPTGRSIRSGEIAVVKDMRTDPTIAPWRHEALKRGYMSSIALPFEYSEGKAGCLTAYGVRIARWSDAEQRLMKQVASALGFGITTLRTAIAKNRFQQDLRESLEQTIQVIADTVEQRDPYTAGHQRRVADLCERIGAKLSMHDDHIYGLRLAASIHDVGKIAVPAEILAKPGRLTEMQYALLKEHPRLGYDIVKNVRFPWRIDEMILQHHERLDGSGYPRRLKSNEILLESRILAVADAVEAMISHRPYRPALEVGEALEDILAGRGTRYDADVVDACVQLFRDEGYLFPE